MPKRKTATVSRPSPDRPQPGTSTTLTSVVDPPLPDRPQPASPDPGARSPFVLDDPAALREALAVAGQKRGWPWDMWLVNLEALVAIQPGLARDELAAGLGLVNGAIWCALRDERRGWRAEPLADYGPFLGALDVLLPDSVRRVLAAIAQTPPADRERWIMRVNPVGRQTCEPAGVMVRGEYLCRPGERQSARRARMGVDRLFGGGSAVDEAGGKERQRAGGGAIPQKSAEPRHTRGTGASGLFSPAMERHLETLDPPPVWNWSDVPEQERLVPVALDIGRVNGLDGTGYDPDVYAQQFRPCPALAFCGPGRSLVVPALFVGQGDVETTARQWNDALYLRRIAATWTDLAEVGAADPVVRLIAKSSAARKRRAELYVAQRLAAFAAEASRQPKAKAAPTPVPAKGAEAAAECAGKPARPAWKRLRLRRSDHGNDEAVLDGATYRLSGGDGFTFLQTLKEHKGQCVKCALLGVPRPDRIHRRLPKPLRQVIEPPGRGQTGYRML